MFKNMTGGDSFEVEQKYGQPYDHQNTAKLVFAANEIPQVDTHQMRSSDGGSWWRSRVNSRRPEATVTRWPTRPSKTR